VHLAVVPGIAVQTPLQQARNSLGTDLPRAGALGFGHHAVASWGGLRSSGGEVLPRLARPALAQRLPCVAVPGEGDDYDYALTPIPGEALRLLYEKSGARLLEANVHSFLSAKGKNSLNAGIQNTASRPMPRSRVPPTLCSARS